MSLASALLLYVMPVLIGRALHTMLRLPKIAYPFVSYLAMGAITLYLGLLGITFVNQLLQLPSSTVFIGYFAGITAIAALINILSFRPKFEALKKSLLVGGASLALALGVYGIWQYNSPYGFNWDLYEHQTLVNNLVEGRVHFLPSQITDTFGFNGYSTILHTLIASAQLMIPTDISSWWHSISILHFGLFIGGVGILAYEVTKQKRIAVISALISAFIFDSNISFTTLFFIPQTFTAVAFLLLFTQLIAGIKTNRLPSLRYILLGVVFLILNHYVIGTMAAGLYVATYFYARYPTLLAQKLNTKLVVGVLIAITAIQAAFFALVPLGSLNHGEAESFISTLPQKFTTMQQAFGFLFLIFMTIAIVQIVRKGSSIQRMILVITTLLFSLILQQAPYVMKFYVLAAGLVNTLLAIGLYEALKRLKNPVLTMIAYVSLLTTLMGVFITNAYTWQEPLVYQNSYAHAADGELQTAVFLKEKYGNSNALLVSDPATTHVIEPFAHINTQGGAYMNSRSRQALDELSQTTDTALIARKVYEVEDQLGKSDTRLLALSGRYFVWQASGRSNKYAFAYNVWNPADLTLEDEKYIRALQADATHFKLVYHNPTIAVFEVYDK